MERSASKKEFEEQRVRVLLELEESKGRTAVLGRVLGALSIGLGAALAYAVYTSMAERQVYVAELLFMAAWALCAGALLLVFGAAGAARLRDVPVGMWAVFAFVSAIAGLVTFVPLGRVLAGLAGLDL